MSVLSKLLTDKALFLSESGKTQLAALILSAKERGDGAAADTTHAPQICYSSANWIGTEKPTTDNSGGVVAIYPLKDIVTKYSSWWSYGSEYLRAAMLENDKDSDVVAHVIDMNSPGGEAYFTGIFAESIRNDIQKPVLTHFNRMCCSAAYYLAAATDGIYASEGTDIVGSIGTMMTMYDFSKAYENMGISVHEIYAPQSTEKNQSAQEAKKGNYKPMQDTFLEPFAAAFIQSVTTHRPMLKDDGHVFKGKEYNAAEAVNIGLIDGIMTLEKVVLLAAQKGGEYQQKNIANSKKTNSMSVLSNFIASLTGEVSADEVKAGANLTAQIDVLTASVEDLKSQLTSAKTANDSFVQSNADLVIEREELHGKIAALTAELTELKAKPQATALKPIIVNEQTETDIIPESLQNAGKALEAYL